MTLNEFTVVLAEPFNRQFDVPFRQMLAERIKGWRARLIHDTLRRNPQDARFFLQNIFIPLTEKELEVCGVKIPGCKYWSSDPIPEGVRGSLGVAHYIGSADGKTPFRETSPGGLYYASLGIADVPSYMLSSSILTLDRRVPVVRMDRIFSDPIKAMEFGCFPDGTSNTCVSWDEQYPISGEIEQMILTAIQQELRDKPDNEQEVIDTKPQGR